VVYASTINLWRSLYCRQGLQEPTFDGLPEMVLEMFTAMHARLDEARRLIPRGRFCEVRYEDLLCDPVHRLKDVYRALDLGDFEPARETVTKYLAGVASYETNRYELTESELDMIQLHWRPIIRRYGYESDL
jgi:hypothetical protein